MGVAFLELDDTHRQPTANYDCGNGGDSPDHHLSNSDEQMQNAPPAVDCRRGEKLTLLAGEPRLWSVPTSSNSCTTTPPCAVASRRVGGGHEASRDAVRRPRLRAKPET